MDDDDDFDMLQLILELDSIELEEQELNQMISLQALGLIFHGITEIQCRRAEHRTAHCLYLTRSEVPDMCRIWSKDNLTDLSHI